MGSCVRVFLAAFLPVVAASVACNQPPSTEVPAPASSGASAQSQIERGRMLVIGGGCHDCHTTKKIGPNGPEPDMSQMLAGHPESLKITTPFTAAPGSPWTIAANDTLTAWSGPWGVSFAANLTPDQNTGMGAGGPWTEEVFVRALRTGKHMGTSRTILPPMPWPMYAQLGDDHLKAIWAYLQTIPAITNHVPDPIPPAATPSTQ